MTPRRPAQPSAPPNYFKAWREYRNLTQLEVEQLYGWPTSRLSNLEKGRALITDQVLAALAQAYGCRVPDLFEPPPGGAGETGNPLASPEYYRPGAAGFAALHDALTALEALTSEAAAIRAAVLPRLDALDRAGVEAGKRLREAVKYAEQLALTFDRAADSLRAVAVRDGAVEAKPSPAKPVETEPQIP